MVKEQKKKNFEITGEFLEKQDKKKFLKNVLAINEQTAKEKLLAVLGSNHRIKRRNIFIKEIKEVS